MSTYTPVCALLGIERPIVEAPLSADPRLPAAVSNAGLGTLGLSWSDEAADVVGQTAALTDRPFSGEPIVRYSTAAPMVGTTGEVEAVSLGAGQSVALANQPQPAADIVAELVSHLKPNSRTQAMEVNQEQH